MDHTNQMREKILMALRTAVEGQGLEWVEVRGGACDGTVRVQRPGRFATLLKFEYEFHARSFALLVHREARHVGGRSGIEYDDGRTIEHLVALVPTLLPGGDPVTVGAASPPTACDATLAPAPCLCGTHVKSDASCPPVDWA